MSILDALRGTPNLSQPLPWLITCGQPSEEQFTAAREAGISVVIDLRDPMEPRSFEEASMVEGLGMEYLNIPVISGALQDESLDELMAALRGNAGKQTMLHCASANRVAGALIPYLMLEQGDDETSAVQTAMQIGLRSAELMDWGTGYARLRLS